MARLHEIAEVLGFNQEVGMSLISPSIQTTRRNELIDKIQCTLLSKEWLQNFLLAIDGDTINACKIMAYSERLVFEQVLFLLGVPVLMRTGVVFVYKKETELVFTIPKELRSLLGELLKCIDQPKRERYQLAIQYTKAAVNLYGVIRPTLIVDIWNKQNETKITLIELQSIHEAYRTISVAIKWIGEVIADEMFYPDQKAVKKLLELQRGKPSY